MQKQLRAGGKQAETVTDRAVQRVHSCSSRPFRALLLSGLKTIQSCITWGWEVTGAQAVIFWCLRVRRQSLRSSRGPQHHTSLQLAALDTLKAHSQLHPLLPGEGVPPWEVEAGVALSCSSSLVVHTQRMVVGGGDDLEDGVWTGVPRHGQHKDTEQMYLQQQERPQFAALHSPDAKNEELVPEASLSPKMALMELKWSFFKVTALAWSLLVHLSLHTTAGMSGWGGCLEAQDVFTTITENSHSGEVVAEFVSESPTEGVHWSLGGNDADWFFLDEGSIRLNTSEDQVLDREALGPVLMAQLSCYEDDALQSVYRIMVEILNENDNLPMFAEDMVHSFTISELTPVDTVVFTVQAIDADYDNIIYSIDPASPDAEYFKVELPNSGEVVLSKPLDYETKTLLTVTIHASEMSTAQHFNTSTNITVSILDGDDQYPQFLPCQLLFQDETRHICTSPVYTVNVTEGEEESVLDFYPGPIHAVDGDRGLSSPLSYFIISGDDDGRFLMDRGTGEVKLIGVAVNRFYPEFITAEHQGFVTAGKSSASLVHTYGSKALMLYVQDQDFDHGFNPMIHFTFSPASNHTEVYQLTQEGLLIARTNQLQARQKHILQVMARDRESGDATFATVVVDVLPEGQSIPLSPLGDVNPLSCTLGKALLLSTVFTAGLGCIVSLVMWLKKKHKGKRNPLQRGCVAQGKHPNVVSHRSGMQPPEEVPKNNEEYGTYNPSFSFSDNVGSSTHQDLPSCRGPAPPRAAAAPDTSFLPTDSVLRPGIFSQDGSVPCSQTRIASAEIDKPFSKACVKTSSYSPLLGSPLPKQKGTPPPIPERAPLTARTVHIDTAPLDAPPVTERSVDESIKVDRPFTSLDRREQSEQLAGNSDAGRSSQDGTSGHTQDIGGTGDVDEDADKDSEEDRDEVDPADEELLRVSSSGLRYSTHWWRSAAVHKMNTRVSERRRTLELVVSSQSFSEIPAFPPYEFGGNRKQQISGLMPQKIKA
ncbi:Cadherin-related family member 5 [Liparis tanakae]|uniref:Cadherin-related family member 5 n=1 Tax=Liparis tanakae TaxID=230148 RepID=A0A4Z2FGU2_9TELE|nr:Cadherin-related family member 5 [Liparis tanakae]